MLILSIASYSAQETPTSVTITEDDINNAISTRLAESPRDIEITVDIQDNQLVVLSRVSNEEGTMGIMFETIYIGDITNGRFTWVGTDWTATTTDGETLDRNDFPRQAFTATDDLWKVVVRDLIRRDMGETRAFELSEFTLMNDAITLGFTARDGQQATTELPPNVTENDDGSVTVVIDDNMLNSVFANVAARNDNIKAISATIGDNSLSFMLDIPACASVIVDFQVIASNDGMTSNRSFAARDWTNDGQPDLGIFTASASGEDLSLTSILTLANATCNGEAMSAQQQQRMNSLLLPAVQRLLQLQTCGATFNALRFEVGAMRLVANNCSYTTCLCNHL